MKKTVLFFVLAFAANVSAQKTTNDGDWKSRYVKIQNTPEAAWMVRCGDIDNLGFGWPAKYTPFSGRETPSHLFPWEQDSTEMAGMDMIMLGSSVATKELPCGGDGYSGSYDVIKNRYGKTSFTIPVPMGLPADLTISSASIMLFVDDFQSPVFCSKFEAYLNGRRAPFLEKTLNALNQTGPIGKLINVKVPADFLDSLKTDTLNIFIDDASTGAGDGYAIDFIKILVNPVTKQMSKGVLKGVVLDENTRKPVAGAKIILSDGTEVLSNTKGEFFIPAALAGMAVLTVSGTGYNEKSFTADVIENETQTIELLLLKK